MMPLNTDLLVSFKLIFKCGGSVGLSLLTGQIEVQI